VPYPQKDEPLTLETRDGVALEAREVCPPEAVGSLVACHPHTLMGGTLESKVVHTLYLAFRDWGFHSLRFNFRGAGASGGSYDGGRNERLDVEAAWHYMNEGAPAAPETSSQTPRVLGGYSFGSYVGLGFAADELSCTHRVGIGLPLSFDYDYSFLRDASDHRPIYLVVGDEDPFCPAKLVEELVEGLRSLDIPTQATLIPGANHMFDKKGHVLRQELSRIAAEISEKEPDPQQHQVTRL
jgi:alpha/beta superfamily hydrolase